MQTAIKKKMDAAENWFLRRILQISWTAKKSNETVLRETDTTTSFIHEVSKRQANLLGHVMRREKIEHLVTTGMFEGKRSTGKKLEKMDGLTKWLTVRRVAGVQKATLDRDA